MPDLYGPDEKLGNEKVQETSIHDPGAYLGVVGRTYRETSRGRSPRERYVTEIFIVTKLGEGDNDNLAMMKTTKQAEHSYDLEFLKNSEGAPRIAGCVFRHTNPVATSADSVNAKNFFAFTRKIFARAFNAFDEENSVVNWKLIQDSIGRFCSFNLVERNRYVNIDIKSFALYQQGKATESSMRKVYDQYAAFLETMSEASGSSGDAAPPPDDNDLPF